MRKPWLKFYPSDWRSDPKLRMCGLAARGLWIEMIGLMHEAQPYGHLVVAGEQPTDTQLAVLVGTAADRIPDLIRELESADVFSRNQEGVIYSRRLTRDEKRTKEGRKSINKRWAQNTVIQQQNSSPNRGPNSPPSTQRPEARGQISTSSSSEPKGSSEAVVNANGADPNPRRILNSDIQKAFDNYNLAAAEFGLPAAQKLTKDRERKLGARLNEHELAGWNKALTNIENTPFLRGENERGWKASLDFLLQPSSFNKVLEGAYGGD